MTSSTSPIQLTAVFDSPFQSTGAINCYVTSAASAANIAYSFFAYNVTTNSWQQLETGTELTSDSTRVIKLPHPQEFIEAGTGDIRLRLAWKQAGPVMVYPWQSRIDAVYCRVWQ